MQKNYQQKPPISFTQSLSRSFLQNQNVLLLHSKGIDVIPSLAQALYIQKLHLVILIDFHQVEIQQLNYLLHQIKQQKVLLQEDIRSDKPQVFMINKFVREKRRKMYISGGIYALTQQIFIMDCMSDTQDLSTGLISKIFIKDAQYNLNDKFSITAWICTILGLNGNKTPITAISTHPNCFKSSNLQTLIRLLYTKKLVLWPFGRSQIHQLLGNTSLPNRNHKLPLTPIQQLLHSNLLNLLKYNQKSPNKADKKQIQKLIYYLLNYDKLNYLALLQNIVNQCTEYSIWKSSNSNIIEIIDKLVIKSRNCVYNLLLVKDKDQLNNNQKEQIYNSDEKQKNQNDIKSQQNYKQIKQKDIIEQTKYRIIDLNTLVPKDNSKNQIVSNQPQIITSVPYKLQYQLHVPGLNQTSLQKSQLFPAKLLQIIRQVKNNWKQYNQHNIKIILNKQDQHIDKIIQSQLQKINNRISNKYSKIQNRILSQIKQDKKEQNQQFIDMIKVERQKQLNQKDKDIQQNAEKKQNSSLKEVKQADIDFSVYQFNKIKINSQRQQNFRNHTLQKQQNQHKQQLQNLFIQNNQVKNNQPIIDNTLPKKYGQSLQVQFLIQNNNPIQQQRIIYICTSHQQLNKYLHYSIYCYQNQLHYIAYLRKLYNYLHLKVQDRISSIKKLIKRYNNPNSSKTGIQKMLILEHQPILLQQLYIQLKLINQIIQKFSAIKDDVGQRDYLFDKQIQRLEFRYVFKQGIRLCKKDYNPLDDCFITLRQGQVLCKARFCIQTNTIIHQLNRNLRVLAPHSVFFYTPSISFIRHINIIFAQGKLLGIQQIHTIYFNNSIQSDKVIKLVKEEDEAFWEIAQERKKLGQYMQNPQVRIKQLIIDDEIQKKARMIALAASTQAKNTRNQLSHINRMHSFAIQRSILIDKRQFKSLLPSYLFHHGFKIIPVFLQNADYILSNDIAIQKKSVHTRDLHQSLKSGRLQEQVKRLCSKFAKPYLLIQCPDLSYFKKEQFSYGFNSITGDKYNFNVRKQLIQIMHKNPKINLIWSTSYMDTVKYFIQLKRNKDQPDLNKFKPQSEQMQKEILDGDGQILANEQQIL